MSAARLLPFLLGGLTLIVLFANALPAVHRKHRLETEQRELAQQRRAETERGRRLAAEITALRHDPFYVERVCAETASFWQPKFTSRCLRTSTIA